MRRYTTRIGIAAIVLLTGLGVQPDPVLSETSKQDSEASALPTPSQSYAPDRILVKTKENASTGAIESVNRKNNARTEKKIPRTRVNVVKLPEELPVEEAVKRYEASPDVEYAEPDYKIYPTQSAPSPNDPRYTRLYGLNNTGQGRGTANADIDAPEAWSATTGDASTVVAVIDTGIDTKHQDLKDNIWVNPGESGDGKETNGIDDDRNGYVDDVNGWDFYHDDNSVFDDPKEDRHGTHVAGTIAGKGNNSLGVVGVNWQAKVMPLKFISIDGGYISGAVEAINYAVDNGAKISNNSWGKGTTFSQAMFDAIKTADVKGHLFVTAAMNGSAGDGSTSSMGGDNDAVRRYPSGYDLPNIIAVAATDKNDSLASFSNYGATTVDLAAPGVSILSTVPGNAYSYGYGTSMATPHVTGVAALVKDRFPDLNDNEIKDRILSSVDPKDSLVGKTATGGRLSAARALGVNTTPMITEPRPTSKTHNRSPTISAMLRDDETDLTIANVEVYVDGQQKVELDLTDDELTYTGSRLSLGHHKVEIIVRDEQGTSTTRTWDFKVVR